MAHAFIQSTVIQDQTLLLSIGLRHQQHLRVSRRMQNRRDRSTIKEFLSPDAALSPVVLPPIDCVDVPGYEVGATWQYQ